MNYNNIRRKTKKINIGNLYIGGDAPVAVQSMTNIDSENYDAAYNQIKQLEAAGCDIVRISAPTESTADTIYKLKCSDLKIPIVADIHYDYRIALRCVEAGVDKVRINPGNIGDEERVKAVVNACSAAGIPIRIGVNSGSLEKEILAKYGAPTPEALAESAMYHAGLIEKYDYDNIVISIKSSSAEQMIAANRIVAKRCTYPLHLGVTEAGTERSAIIKSAVGIGSLICDGIGDTIRVSITGDPVTEIPAGIDILKAVGIFRKGDVDIISCPTCGRTKIDLIALAKKFESRKDELKNEIPLRIAIMGCAVNGPGEAREADYGLAGGNGEAVIFCHGNIIKKVSEDMAVDALIEEINKNTTEN